MQNIIFTANNVAPVFLIVAIGILLKQTHLINDNFVSFSSKVVFTISLPALIFNELSNLNLSTVINFNEIIFVYAATLASYIIIWLFAARFVKEGKDRGSFIQGAFRGNYAIVGLAIAENLFGKDGLGKASLILAFILPIYNILAVIALTFPLRKEKNLDAVKTLIEILKNPLIIAVVIALPFSIWHIPINEIISRSIGYLADLALPLALIGIGGSLNIKQIKKVSVMAFSASAYKIIFIPLVFTYIAFLSGYKGMNLGILFILFASPTAVASFVMAEAMGCNEKLAGNIVLITTIFSVLTIALGLFLLKSFALI